MPQQRGRKNKRERIRERRRDRVAVAQPPEPDATGATTEARAVQQTTVHQPLPSPTARVSGVMIAIITFAIAGVMVYNGATGDNAGIDSAMRIVAGVLLILLAIAVAVLSASPDTVRRLLRRG
jgi:hypothetical protein